MPSSYPGDLDALPLPDFGGALGQPARPASEVITNITDAIKALQASVGTTDDPGPLLIGNGNLVLSVRDDFGMVPDVVDDTKFQTALTAAAAIDGATLYFGPGNWLRGAGTVPSIAACDGLTIDLGGGVIKAHSSKPLTNELLKTTVAGAPTRTVKNLTIRNGVIDGGSLAPERWLQNPSTGATITNPQADYYDVTTNPSGKIGNPSFPTYDVDDLITDNRRNPDYVDTDAMLKLSLTEDTLVENVTFRNHYGVALSEAGGLNVTIRRCVFDTVGKSDGPYPAIWTQSHGDPAAPTGSYQDSENIAILDNTARDLERCFVIFAPTMGGRVVGNRIDNWRESCIFVGPNLHYTGGDSQILNNVMRDGIVADITCNGIESGRAKDLEIRGNTIVRSAREALVLTGGLRINVKDNRLRDCGSDFTYPYGPYSERYAFNIGQAPIAGNAFAIEDGAYIRVGTLADEGCDHVVIRENLFRETRATFPDFVIQQAKTGSAPNNLSKLCVIEGNTLNVPTGMGLLDTGVGNVWDTTMPLHIRGNTGHVSESSVIHVKQFATSETGGYVVTVGFRPSKVRIFAAANTPSLGMSCVGTLLWQASGTSVFMSEYLSTTSGTGQQVAITDAQLAKLVDASNVSKFVMTTPVWKEDGFSVTIGTCSQTTNVRFVCEP